MLSVPTVSVFMDVEDPINPLADSAALDFPKLFDEEGVRGSFCITGEKCRVLMERGRLDVRDALAPHCLGLHTDTHSYHPTTMELLADLDYEVGCKAAFEAERKGYDAFTELFGRTPVFWGGAGNTWSPEITDALKKLQISAYSYALTSLPNHAVHRFNGVIALPQALSISEVEWADDDKAAAGMERVLSGIRTSAQPWLGIFVGHPTRFRHERYWDLPFNYGVTPAAPELARPLPEDVYKRSKANLSIFLKRLRGAAPVIGLDEFLQSPWQFRKPATDELAHFRERTPENIRSAAKWPIHRPGLDTENMVRKTMALEETVEVAVIERPYLRAGT